MALQPYPSAMRHGASWQGWHGAEPAPLLSEHPGGFLQLARWGCGWGGGSAASPAEGSTLAGLCLRVRGHQAGRQGNKVP